MVGKHSCIVDCDNQSQTQHTEISGHSEALWVHDIRTDSQIQKEVHGMCFILQDTSKVMQHLAGIFLAFM